MFNTILVLVTYIIIKWPKSISTTHYNFIQFNLKFKVWYYKINPLAKIFIHTRQFYVMTFVWYSRCDALFFIAQLQTCCVIQWHLIFLFVKVHHWKPILYFTSQRIISNIKCRFATSLLFFNCQSIIYDRSGVKGLWNVWHKKIALHEHGNINIFHEIYYVSG